MAAVAVIVVAVPAIRWRIAIVTLKAVGQLPSADWGEVAYILRPNTSVRLSRLTRYRDPFMVIANPAQSARDVAQGRELFAVRCARCHGDGAQGGVGPALVGRSLAHGDSDWAVFRTIRHGVPGTAMLPVTLPKQDVWRIIAFLHEMAYARSAQGSAIYQPGGSGEAPVLPPAGEVTVQMLATAASDLDDWLLPSGSYSAQRFSADTQINTANVSQLRVQWIHQFGTSDAIIESIPIIVGPRLYVTLPQGTVMALDAGTGRQLWEYTRPAPADVRLCCVTANRGVAVSGTRVYVGTLDAHLLALDATTGALLWDRTVASYRDGYSITSAPLPVGKLIVTGIAGGDFPTRGFISAYDATTGEPVWRTYTIPGPGEPGHDTWGGDSWRIGGATTWGIGSYDPQLGLLYWGTGNPAPDYNAASRPGDNLYSNSLLALDAATGRIVWHFQYTPADDHDWDSTQTPSLIDLMKGDTGQRLLAVANRNGFFYVLDRANGRFVRGTQFVKQTWAQGLLPSGRPARLPNTSPTPRGVYLYPSTTGATNWWMSAYSPLTGYLYVDVLERGGLYFSTESPPSPARGKLYAGSGGRYVPGDFYYTAVRAIDPATGSVRWDHHNSGYNDSPRGGLLATAGGVVFGSDTSTLFALNASNGTVLWSFDTGGQISAPPVSYRVAGRQYVSVASGELLMTFALPPDSH